MPVSQLRSISPGVEQGGSDGHIPPDMNERIVKLEGQIDGLKHGQAINLGGLALVAGLVAIVVGAVVGFGIYQLQRIDQVGDRVDRISDKVNELPGKMGAELRDISKALSESITAAKTQNPTVIVLPAPQSPPSTVMPPK